eukprot:837824-Amphidinium_carterae.1
MIRKESETTTSNRLLNPTSLFECFLKDSMLFLQVQGGRTEVLSAKDSGNRRKSITNQSSQCSSTSLSPRLYAKAVDAAA